MDYKDLIARMKSVRDYKKDVLSNEIIQKLDGYCKNSKKLVEGINTEVMLKAKADVYDELKNDAGYNDLMLEAPHYLLFFSEEKDNYIENTGYAVQDIMLKAFELGVGSCWITIRDGELVKNKLGINTDKKLTALVALGLEEDNKNKTIVENVSEYNPSKANVSIVKDNVSERMGVTDIVYMKKWGEKAELDDLVNLGLADAFFYARLAPSTKNRQPWRFMYDNGIVVLAVRKDESTNEYEEKIDAGIVMLYFKLIVDSTLFNVAWKLGKTEKEYEIASDYSIVAYCNS